MALVKPWGERKSSEELDQAVRQLVSKPITAEDEIIDVFSATGLKKPDISILFHSVRPVFGRSSRIETHKRND